jgi:adenylylsulfate kinase
MGGNMSDTRAQPRAAVLWFTGLSGSGKSTIGAALVEALRARGLEVEHLDGDTVRGMFPTGFTRGARDQHIRRMGFIAGLLERHGVWVVATFVSPYRAARAFARAQCRRFVEIHVSTPLAVCERRDVKGLYARARRGEIDHFTGISDPYEAPARPDVAIDTRRVSAAAAVRRILKHVGLS